MFGAGTNAEPEEGYTDSSPSREPWLRRATKAARSHWILSTLAVVGLLVIAGGAYVVAQVHNQLSVTDVAVDYTVPAAPKLIAGNGETVYRIDPTQSSVTYGVDENIVGQTANHATGSTNGIAGDLALNASNPSSSRVGKIVINVEQLHSDNNGRDAQLRQRYLDSKDNPLATFSTTSITGLPSTVADGQTYKFDLVGNMTIKSTTAPVTWKVEGKVDKGQLSATATTTVKMSSFAVGPINLAGLVTTGDNVGLTFKFVALDPSKFSIPTTINPPEGASHTGSGPSFKTVVQPILEQNCASCHAPGQVGAAHWQLSTAADASSIADGIGVVTQAKYMPPWPASSQGVPLLHSKAMSQHDIDQVTAWAKAGGKLDEASTTPIVATKPKPGVLPRKDVVMKMPEPYTGSLSNTNDYRCFVLDPHLTKPEYLTGYTVEPQKITEIHHAQIFHITAGQVEGSKSISGADGKPGWSCYTGPNLPDKAAATARNGTRGSRLSASFGGGGVIAGWVPGQDPAIYPENSGILFQPGDAIVLQLHYHYDKQPTPDQSTVALQFDSADKAIKPLAIENPIGPVEIPCMPGVVAPLCDRNAALADDARLYGPAGSFIEPGLLGLCGKTSDQLAALFQNGVAHTTCDYRIPMNGTIVGVMGHMHTLGKSITLSLDPGTPSAKTLLDIPTWNFDWQMSYALAQPVHVTRGETFRMSCSWDRSLDPNRPPKYIVFAEGTEDEMCFSTYAIIPDQS